MWPYGYTKTDVPSTMTQDDHQAFVALAHNMANLNGYTARQGSDSYIYDGDFPAWGYGNQRLFVFTLEMYPTWGSKAGGFKPDDAVIEEQTSRNRDAVLYLLEQSDCPWRSAGLGWSNCGPIYDDFEVGRGWRVDPFGTDTATRGAWARGIPQASSDAAGAKQLGGTASGRMALVTSLTRGRNAAANDLDGGTTTARSRAFKLGAGASTLSFQYAFGHNTAATEDDGIRVSVRNSAGVVTPVWSEAATTGVNRNARWQSVSVALDAWAGQTVTLLVQATDAAAGSLIEVAVDDVRVFQTP